jgi:hypothetical protein
MDRTYRSFLRSLKIPRPNLHHHGLGLPTPWITASFKLNGKHGRIGSCAAKKSTLRRRSGSSNDVGRLRCSREVPREIAGRIRAWTQRALRVVEDVPSRSVRRAVCGAGSRNEYRRESTQGAIYRLRKRYCDLFTGKSQILLPIPQHWSSNSDIWKACSRGSSGRNLTPCHIYGQMT